MPYWRFCIKMNESTILAVDVRAVTLIKQDGLEALCYWHRGSCGGGLNRPPSMYTRSEWLKSAQALEHYKR